MIELKIIITAAFVAGVMFYLDTGLDVFKGKDPPPWYKAVAVFAFVSVPLAFFVWLWRL